MRVQSGDAGDAVMMLRRALLAACVTMTATSSSLVKIARGDAATKPSFNPSTELLGSSDPHARDEAAAALRAAGKEAEAALKKAAGAGDPEVARRARGLLGAIGRAMPEEIAEADSPD